MWKFVSAGNWDGSGQSSSKNPLLRSLNDHCGRQIWIYDEKVGSAAERATVEQLRKDFTANRHQQRHSSDELLRLQFSDKISKKRWNPPSGPVPEKLDEKRVAEHLKGAISFYECLQQDDGHWPGDYGGPMFLFPGLIITLYMTGVLDQVFTPAHKEESLRYLRNHQNEDGGFGLHIEGGSTMFGTSMSYVTLRIFGVSPDEEMMIRARTWIHSRGGANTVTSWGKFWLAVLGVFSWDGLNPLTPEMWLLPHSKWTGIGYAHPGRFWCHCRMVYLPMSYVYGARASCKDNALTRALREELYPVPYDTMDWNGTRNIVAKEDLFYPHPFIQDVLWWILYKAENVLMGSWLRKKAMEEIMKHIHYEDENTRYIDIGPVNKVMNMLCCWLEDPNSEAFKKHIPRVYDYLWVAEDGLKMQGYNGSQLWDTSFAVQAIAASGLLDVSTSCLAKAHSFIEASQVVEEAQQPLSDYYRHISKGAWPFSTRDHGWPISDCSSEGLKAALILANLPEEKVGSPLSDSRFFDCVNVILSYQNFDGGMATYENTRSFHCLEVLNPSETFGDIIVDYSYVECTSACITALCAFRERYPEHRSSEIVESLRRAEGFIRTIQRKDGSWYGSWAVCFTYACWFGVSGLVALGHTYQNDKAVKQCIMFVLDKQREDGGWGESYLSCEKKVYSQLAGDSHVVNTAWALLTLMTSGYHKVDPKPLHRAAKYLILKQSTNGDWPQQHISGVFNRNCMITYANYRNIFPIWALGLYRRAVLLAEDI
ncbi:hypothetical protein CEUSTIGMA_g2587.t1 [Chlamydomonas eustigma]|uniref:Terpene cyclase/mutase family member n=1 Tax=Chlamydomonas eustigma TaxID=1157962 RepID=A0A250WWB4_9CHLO|nr:hypothetical protein CEUSTIGMA_g2587.t1 [Chlamydomonas eustigma]|eukprot:GAX75143.1 hypothetical protein CEUSTIGMA_g2587.t1 [Chlamydomonas eustigma]